MTTRNPAHPPQAAPPEHPTPGPARMSTAAATAHAHPDADAAQTHGMGEVLRPLLIDVAVPLGLYYLLNAGFGMSVWFSLAISGIIPVIRTVASLVTERKINTLAALMLVANVGGIAISFLTGDPRMMIAKDAVISSAVGLGMLFSVAVRRPVMSAALKPFMTYGKADRIATWDRLSAQSARFRRLELLFTAVWGLCELADCVARLVGAFTLPVTTMVWMGTVLVLASVVLASLISGVAAGPMRKMIDTETA
jgi:hypothetical protein